MKAPWSPPAFMAKGPQLEGPGLRDLWISTRERIRDHKEYDGNDDGEDHE